MHSPHIRFRIAVLVTGALGLPLVMCSSPETAPVIPAVVEKPAATSAAADEGKKCWPKGDIPVKINTALDPILEFESTAADRKATFDKAIDAWNTVLASYSSVWKLVGGTTDNYAIKQVDKLCKTAASGGQVYTWTWLDPDMVNTVSTGKALVGGAAKAGWVDNDGSGFIIDEALGKCRTITMGDTIKEADIGWWTHQAGCDPNFWYYFAANGPGQAQYDYYTVLQHELGHLLGLADDDVAEVMNGSLPPGIRRELGATDTKNIKAHEKDCYPPPPKCQCTTNAFCVPPQVQTCCAEGACTQCIDPAVGCFPGDAGPDSGPADAGRDASDGGADASDAGDSGDASDARDGGDAGDAGDGGDGGADAQTDSPSDAPRDAVNDGPRDAISDTSVDATTDATIDATTDSPTDGAADADGNWCMCHLNAFCGPGQVEACCSVGGCYQCVDAVLGCGPHLNDATAPIVSEPPSMTSVMPENLSRAAAQ